MTTALADACADLETWLPRARILLAQPDTAPTTGHAAPGSQPPWNAAVADALFGALEGIRGIEQDMRERLSGRSTERRPHAQAGATIRSIQRLAHALPDDGRQDITRQLARYTLLILQLPAVGREERWRKIAGAPCPYCGVPMLLAAPQSGRVTCLRYGACFDSRDCHPTGVMAVGDVSGQPMIAWADGFIQVPAEGTP